MVRSPKSIGGTVGATLGNAPYSDSDRTQIEFFWRTKRTKLF